MTKNVTEGLNYVGVNFLVVFVVVTIYATLGEDAIAHGINETEVSFVITTHDLLPKFKTVLKSTPKVKTIIYMEDQLSETDTSGLREDVNVIAFKEVIKKGESLKIGRFSLASDASCDRNMRRRVYI